MSMVCTLVLAQNRQPGPLPSAPAVLNPAQQSSLRSAPPLPGGAPPHPAFCSAPPGLRPAQISPRPNTAKLGRACKDPTQLRPLRSSAPCVPPRSAPIPPRPASCAPPESPRRTRPRRPRTSSPNLCGPLGHRGCEPGRTDAGRRGRPRRRPGYAAGQRPRRPSRSPERPRARATPGRSGGRAAGAGRLRKAGAVRRAVPGAPGCRSLRAGERGQRGGQRRDLAGRLGWRSPPHLRLGGTPGPWKGPAPGSAVPLGLARPVAVHWRLPEREQLLASFNRNGKQPVEPSPFSPQTRRPEGVGAAPLHPPSGARPAFLHALGAAFLSVTRNEVLGLV